MRNRKGFTLIELLLVVAILAFLIAIIVIAASNISEDSKKKAMYASLRSVKTAMETYYIQNGEFPDPAKWDLDTNDLLATSGERLIDSIPVDIFNPVANEPVGYDLDTTANKRPTYVAWSVGPNKASPIAVGEDKFDTAPDSDDIYVTNVKGKIWKP